MKPSFLAPCLLFFLLCTLKPVYSAAVSTLPLQLRALLSLKSSLTDPLNTFQDWEIVSALNTQDSVWCSWSGIKCNPRTSQITSLNLSNRNLSGLIPDELRYLTSLIHFNLSRNLFDGPFQDIVFQLRNIRVLDISHNNFNSTFPSGISRLKLLRIFNAYSNSFTGVLPDALAELHYVEYVNLGGSYFEGEIPTGYGNFPRLSFLDLAGNSLEGPLPPQLGRLTQLQHLELGYNADLSGPVPHELGLLTSLQYLDISKCNLSGPIPDRLGNLVDLRILLLFSNHLTGPIPPSLANLSSLQELDLSDNKLTGSIPDELSSELTRISLMQNQLTGEIPEGVGSLPKLEALLIWNNSFTGSLPWGLGSNGKLQWLDVSTNNLTGPLPLNLCQGNNLFKLILFSNNFNGTLPSSLANCTSLARVRIQNNGLTGSIPVGFGQLPNLTYVDFSDNNFGGGIPDDLLHAPQLQFLNVSENAFGSALPRSIWRAPALQVFSASFAGLTGSIPEFLGCSGVYKIELDGNRLNGSVPFDIGHCGKLIGLNLSRNSLTGIIPWEISALPSITAVDLSHNRFTGTIPSDFANCTTLETFDVSFNQLAGPIPSTGAVFPNLHPSSFAGNNGLCGWVISRPCPEAYADGDTEVNRKEPRRTAGAVVWIMAVAFGVGLFVLFAVTRCYLLRRGHGGDDEEGGGRGREIIRGPWKLTAFQRLNFTADDVAECVSTTDRILGMGSTGTVYKAEMPGGEIIAVKKLWGKNKDQQGGGLSIIRRRRGVLAEVEVLGSVRHRNIVRLLGCCSNRECTMLLYEYMPNGNLDDLLHGKNKGSENLGADWVIRYTIALGVAQGICYLHHDCDPVIVHRDLKPSNILLDGEMEARVADFGVAKLIQTDESMSVIAGSYGYIAPEYAYTLQVDEKSDIYSFGVVLMEIISGKRSVDSEFGEGNSIVDWVRTKIRTRDGVLDVLDKNAGAAVVSVREEMMQMLRIALLCTARNPGDRPSMRDVVMMLQEARPKRKLPGAATVVISDDDRRRRRESNGSDRVIMADDDSTEKASSLEC